MVYIKWQCLECNDIIISNSQRHHQMDFCKCGKSGCDLEEYSQRWSSANKLPKVLKKYNYDFFTELILCLDEQGFKPFIKIDKLYLDISTVMMVRKMEDELLRDLI